MRTCQVASDDNCQDCLFAFISLTRMWYILVRFFILYNTLSKTLFECCIVLLKGFRRVYASFSFSF